MTKFPILKTKDHYPLPATVNRPQSLSLLALKCSTRACSIKVPAILRVVEVPARGARPKKIIIRSAGTKDQLI